MCFCNFLITSLQGLTAASGKVLKGQGGPKSFEDEDASPKGRQFKVIKKSKQRLDHDDDFSDEDDGNKFLYRFQNPITCLIYIYVPSES